MRGLIWLVLLGACTLFGCPLKAQNVWPAVLKDLKQGQSPTLLEDGSRLMTSSAYDLLMENEVGGGQDYYNKYLVSPTWPKEKSGITIGVGYDLGYCNIQEFLSDWGPYLSPTAINRLSACLGVTGASARHLLQAVDDIKIPWEYSRRVFITRTLPRSYLDAVKTFPGFELLPADAQGALVSLVLNRGTSLEGDTRLEMAEIKKEVAVGDLKGISASLRHMKHIWVGHGVDGLLRRRDDEANLVDQAGKGFHDASYIALPPLDSSGIALTPPVSSPLPSEQSVAPLPPLNAQISTPAVFADASPTRPTEITSCMDILSHLDNPATRQDVSDYENRVLDSPDDENKVRGFAAQLLDAVNTDVKASNQRRLVRIYLSSPEDVDWLQANQHLVVPGSVTKETIAVDLTDMTDLDGCPPTMKKRLLAIARLSIVQVREQQSHPAASKPWNVQEYTYAEDNATAHGFAQK